VILLISASWVARITGVSHCAWLPVYILIVATNHSNWDLLTNFFWRLFFLVGLEFELRALQLQSRYSTTYTTPPVHFALVILEMGVSGTIYLGWPQTSILPISASQVASITGMSHRCLAEDWILISHQYLVFFPSICKNAFNFSTTLTTSIFIFN
jgi:hypothetical protein